jgi:hypothetical protein
MDDCMEPSETAEPRQNKIAAVLQDTPFDHPEFKTLYAAAQAYQDEGHGYTGSVFDLGVAKILKAEQDHGKLPDADVVELFEKGVRSVQKSGENFAGALRRAKLVRGLEP